jgi:hypothetical protein
MTLGNMRENGVRSLFVSCWQCHHQAVLSADPWSDDIPVPAFGPAHGMDALRHYRCRRELEGEAGAGELDGAQWR